MSPKSTPHAMPPATWDETRLNFFERAVEGLVRLSKEDFVVVEGRKDARSLKRIGVIAQIVVCNRDGSLHSIESNARLGVQRHRIVLLPDFDREGREKMRRWRSSFSRGMNVDTGTWRLLSSLLKSEGIGIEGLANLAHKLGFLRDDIWLGPEELPKR